MSVIFAVLKILSVVVAAFLMGNWFLSEVKKAKMADKPWYAAYLTLPGILILVAIIVLPLIIRIAK